MDEFRPRSGRRRTGNINLLPINPLALLGVIQRLDHDPDSLEPIHDLARLDPGLCLNILVRAKLHPDHVPGQVLSLETALKTLGWPGLRGLAFHLAALQVLTPLTGNERQRWEELAREACGCAWYGAALADHFKVAPEEAYLAGLFSNLANLFAPPASGDSHEDGQSVRDAAWGAEILEELGFPSLFTDAIRYIHEPSHRIDQALPLVQTVHLARRLARGALITDEVREPKPSWSLQWQQEVAESSGQALRELGLEQSEDAESGWAKAREELTAEVRNMVLETGALLAAPGIDESFVDSGHPLTDLASELGARGVMLFVHQPDNNRLVARYYQGWTGGGPLNQMSLPADRGKNAMVRCWMSGRTCHSLSQTEGKERQLVDEQLRRLMKVEALACWLLNHGGRPRGVLVLGCEAAGLHDLMKHPELPNLIARATRLLAGLTDRRTTPKSAAI